MTGRAATGGMQWQQGDVRVTLDVTPAEVTAALSRLWQRISQGVDALAAEEWEQPTRCSEWRVVDVVNHLADAGAWVTTCMDALRDGRSTAIFANFDPISVPKRLTDAADRTPAAARRRLATAFEGMQARVAGLDEAAMRDIHVETPLGLQPPAVALSHLAWDTWLHERDLFLPLGRKVPELADDVRLAALYALRMEAYIETLTHREVHAGLVLRGALDETLALDVTAAEVRIEVLRDGEGNGTAPAARTLLHGDAATVVDALSGRGDVAAALEGPEDVRSTISMMRTFLAGA
jgi:uncharacterized protein (TIGR03083 family)